MMQRLGALHESEKPQRSILATWIVEICLEHLNALRDGGTTGWDRRHVCVCCAALRVREVPVRRRWGCVARE